MLKTYKQHIAYIGLSILLCVFSAASIIKFVNPHTAGTLTFIFLYSSIFLGVVGLATLCGLLLRLWLVDAVYMVNLTNSLRQAILLGLMIIGWLVLSANGLLFWWVALSLIIFLSAIEVFLSVKI